MYLTYFAFAILIAVAEVVKTSNKGQEDHKPFHITTQVIYWLWVAMNIVISSSIWVGRRQSIAWTGLYTTLSYGVFIAGTLASFNFSFTISDFPIEYVVLILMACTVFILERIIEPRDQQVSKRKRQVTFTLYPSDLGQSVYTYACSPLPPPPLIIGIIKLYCAYKGVISRDQIGMQPPAHLWCR